MLNDHVITPARPLLLPWPDDLVNRVTRYARAALHALALFVVTLFGSLPATPANDASGGHPSLAAPPSAPNGAPPQFAQFCRLCGLHPFGAFTLFALDQLMVGMEIASFGILIIVSFCVGAALVVPMTLLQKYAYREPWGAAVAKGVLAGLLTSVPGSFMSVGTALFGLAGIVGMRHRDEQ